MAGGVVLVKRSPEEVADAPDGKVRVFIDEGGRLALKDEDGAVVSPLALIATLEASVATKQSAATAATDTELATAVTSLTASIAAKQDASSAATDAELSAAAATINAAISAEEAARKSADATEKTAREAADSAEKVAREDGDAGGALARQALSESLSAAIAQKQDAATAATDAELAAGLVIKQSVSEKGQAGGYPSLDGSGHVPASQMPVGALTYKGAWNAATNTPTLSDGAGSVGEQYAITVSGTRNLGSGSVEYKVGAILLHNGTIWQQIASPNDIASVFGRKGVVVSQSGDYSIGQIAGAGTAAGKDSGAAGSAGKVLDADDPVLPAAGQKNALVGNDGTPGSTNPYLTKQSLGSAGAAGKALKADDPTTVDARTPVAHAASHKAGGADPVAPGDIGAAPAIETVKVVAASGAAKTIDLSEGSVWDITGTAAAVAVTLPAPVKGRSFGLALRQDASGGRVFSLVGAVKWSAGVSPALSIAAGAVDVLYFTSLDGATWLGMPGGFAFAEGGAPAVIPAVIQTALNAKEEASNKEEALTEGKSKYPSSYATGKAIAAGDAAEKTAREGADATEKAAREAADKLTAAGVWLPSDYGYKAWTGDPNAFTTSSLLPEAGRLEVVRLKIAEEVELSKTFFGLTTAGSGDIANAFIAWFQEGKLLAQSPSQVTAWKSGAATGLKEAAMAFGKTVKPGFLEIVFWVGSGTTMPTFIRGTGAGGGVPILNGNLSAENARYASANTGIGAAAPESLGAKTARNLAWWVAVA